MTTELDRYPAARRLVLWGFLVASIVDLVAVAVPAGRWEWAVKPLLMPLLAVYLVIRLGPVARFWPVLGRVFKTADRPRRAQMPAGGVVGTGADNTGMHPHLRLASDHLDLAAARPGLRRHALVALVFATAGDVALLFAGDTAFLIGLGLFAVTHLAYVVTFVRGGGLAGLRRRWWVPVGYALAWIALVVTVFGRVETVLLVILAGYGLILFSMATTAGGLDVRLGLGGLLFAGSDVLDGLGFAHLALPEPAHGLLVMVFYLAGQAVLVVRYGTLSLATAGRPAPALARRG